MSKLANLVGEVLDQKYQIDHQLGQGGMGAVYKATHLGTERPVALKVIMPEFMQEKRFIERFKLEAKATGRLRHPNVVNVTDFGFAQVNLDQVAYLVMEYLNGFTLGDMLRKQKKLSLSVTIDILEQTCLAVSEAHKLGIIHRDLKPDNIWLEPNGRGGYNVKVLDFGLAQLHDLAVKPQQLVISLGNETTSSIPAIDLEAKTQAANNFPKSLKANTLITEENQSQAITQANLLEANTIANIEEAATIISIPKNKAKATSPLALEMEKITQIGAIVGTPLYMSPEQCQGETLDFRTDIYSLGIIVYQMLTGKPPFTGNLNQLLVQHIQSQPPALTKKDHNVASAIAKIIMGALDKNPDNRPVSATAFAAELKASSEGELPILREALSLYRRNFNTFFKTSLFVYLPYLIFYFLLIAVAKSLPNDFSYLIYLLNNSYWLIAILVLLFANATSLGIFALVVREVQKFPQNTISLLPFLRTYFANFTKIITTALFANFQLLFNYALCVPVILLEQKSNKEALARSSFLVNYLKPTLIALQIHSLFLSVFSLLIAPISFVIINLVIFIINEEKSKLLLEKGTLAAFIFIPSAFILLSAILLILVYPIVAIAFVLFYFKTRIILGENPIQETPLDQANSLATNLSTRNYAREKRSSLLALILIFTLVGWLSVKNIALTLATTGGFTSVVEALILVGANANAKISTSLFDFDGEFTTTPLIHAVSNAKQQKELVATLLKNGANVNTANDYGWTPIMEAVIKDDFETLEVLISYGADVNVTTSQGWTPLMWAIKRSNLDIVKYLLNNNADINMLTENGKTALHISIETGNAYITKQLLDYCEQVNIADDEGNTALSLAAQGGDSYIVKLLIKKNAFIDHQNKVGQTPLILATINNQKEAIKELFEATAKPEIKDNSGKIALDYAKDREIINLLTNQ